MFKQAHNIKTASAFAWEAKTISDWCTFTAAILKTHLKGSTSYGQTVNTLPWPESVSMETTVSLLSHERLNVERTWDDSYKLFPNLVIFYFNTAMNIGLQWQDRKFILLCSDIYYNVRYGMVWRLFTCYQSVVAYTARGNIFSWDSSTKKTFDSMNIFNMCRSIT